jgi:hypothetical protein
MPDKLSLTIRPFIEPRSKEDRTIVHPDRTERPDVRSVAGDQHHSGDGKPKPDGIGTPPTPVLAIQGASEENDEDQSDHMQTYNCWLDSTMAQESHRQGNW